MKRLLRALLKAIPGFEQMLFLRGAFTGHFYSPIPSMKEVRKNREAIFGVPRELPGIDLREEEEMRLVEIFARQYYRLQPFRDERTDGLTYFFQNEAFCHTDAIMLHCMLRHFRPRRVIEIGSGFSSCVTLDTNRLFLDNSIKCIFIDPYSDVLKKLRGGNVDGLNIVPKRAQDVPLDVFRELQDGDILFVDSSHVTKVGSDVNHIVFNILPCCAQAFGFIFTMCSIHSSIRKTGYSTGDRGAKRTCCGRSYSSMARFRSNCFQVT